MPHKLLLADDSITIQRVIELTFADEDVQVLAVGDGKHAIDRIQTDRPDIVLADVGMPEQDGYEVAAFVKRHPQLSHIPVLLLTGAFEPVDEGRARAVGCDGVLVKPFEPQMVINRVKDLLAGRRAGAPGTPSSNDEATPSAEQAPQAASPGQQKQSGDSLEDYFDRLDAAFATLGGEAAPAPARPSPVVAPAAAAVATSAQRATAEDFASWDPDITGDATRPATHETVPAAVAAPAAPTPIVPIPVVAAPAAATARPAAEVPSPSAPHKPVAVTTAAPAPMPISLAEAFATLLAAEHGQAIAPAGEPRPAPASAPAGPPSPEVVDDIVRRVIDKLQDHDVRQTVVDVAERLVREEIDRIKRANG